MKKITFLTNSILLIFSFATVFYLNSCNDNEINPKILNAYKEILVVRESVTDNNLANKEVAKVLKKYNMTEKEFRTEMFEIMKNNKEFVKLLDSVRNTIKIENDSLLNKK